MNAIRIRMDSHLRSFGIFFAAICLIMLVLSSGILSGVNVSGTVSATVISVAIFCFVLGICSAREDIRLLMQFGISRRTSFLTRFVSALLLSVIGGVASELLMMLSVAIAAEGVEVYDLYNIFYTMPTKAVMTFGRHMEAIVMNTALILAVYEFGEFFSLMFFRVKKLGAIICGICIWLVPCVLLPLIVGIPVVGSFIGPVVVSLFNWMGLSVWNLIGMLLLWTLLSLAINYLLMRRAPIKAAKG